jgi:succinoglycan biosynthesis transport protein ExoP
MMSELRLSFGDHAVGVAEDRPPRIAVLIPCYNEEITIGKVVAEFCAALPSATIFVYDNNSSDRTFEVAQKAGAVVRKEARQGKGNVVRQVATTVVRQLKLTEDPEFVGSGNDLKSRILSLIKLGKPQTESSNEEVLLRVVATLKDNLRITRLGRSYIEQISYASLHRDKAARIANAYIEDQIQAKFEATRRASAWLEQRIGELRKQASDAYKEVQDFKSENGIIIGVDGKLASEAELDQLGIALAKARAETSEAKARLDRIERVLEQRTDKETLNIPDPVVTDALSNPVITKLRQQFLDDQNKESEWSARYGADHQAARNLRAEMAALQRAIWDEISRIGESYKSELQITKSQEESIDRRMGEVFQQSGSMRQSQVRLRELRPSWLDSRNRCSNNRSRRPRRALLRSPRLPRAKARRRPA